MNDYKDKLSGFANRLKTSTTQTPIQEVKPVSTLKPQIKDDVQLNIWISRSLMKQIKSRCLEKDLSIKDFVTITIENELNI